MLYEVREYVDGEGNSPFRAWFQRLSAPAADRVARAIRRMEQGNLGDVQPIGSGLSEHRIHAGPGYRIDFGREGKTLIILLAGGTKKRQARDMATAKALWRHYKQKG